LPGLLLAVGCGVMVFLVLLLFLEAIGWAATLAVPVSIGAILGYRCRVRPVAYVFLALCALIGIMASMLFLDITGLLCSIIAFVIMVGPVLVGTFFGLSLRNHLKKSGFSQRSYLPILILVALPLVLGVMESLASVGPTTRAVRTSRVVSMPIDVAWRSIRYYEQLSSDRPILFRLGAPHPIGTLGDLANPGDVQTCEYRKGHVTKKLRTSEHLRRIVFDVIQQDIGFERSVRLRSGSFEFEAVGSTSTRISLQTEYDAMLRPRWCWAPAETYVLWTLHNYILDGVEERAFSEARRGPESTQLAHDLH